MYTCSNIAIYYYSASLRPLAALRQAKYKQQEEGKYINQAENKNTHNQTVTQSYSKAF